MAWAWGGLGLVVAHGVLRAFVKYKLNEFYGEFYDFGGAAAEVDPADEAALARGRRRMTELLVYFAALCAPNVLLHPLYKLITNRWVLSWRLCLMHSYMERWRSDGETIENGAQRVHEDTARFARGLHTCLGTLLDSALTLAAFAPLLVRLGAHVQPVALPAAWLLALCGAIALLGVLGSVALGWSLIALEVQNQKAEADLRRELVLLEERPRDGRSWQAEREPSCSPVQHFLFILARLRDNYRRLYSAFCMFSLWLQTYEQTVVLTPYFIAAPLLYSADQATRLTLGSVTQLANAFSQVFASLNVVTDNWLEVTDWLSVLRRLREWERHLGRPTTVSTATLIPVGHERSGATEMQET